MEPCLRMILRKQAGYNIMNTIYKILFEGILYYVGVGIVEEFYVRGLFLNIVEALLKHNSNRTLIAIIVSKSVGTHYHACHYRYLCITVLFYRKYLKKEQMMILFYRQEKRHVK